MKLFRQEVLRVLLLDARFRQISIDSGPGALNAEGANSWQQ